MHEADSRKTSVIALCGKGGVGKTSLSATIVKILSSNPDTRVLAIDADPAVGLSTALGIDVTKTVDDIRNELIRRVESGESADKKQMLSMLDYEMFSALKEQENVAFLAIGRPEKVGCYCQVNDVLKDLIASLAVNFDFVVIDGEAGIEQVNRRVMERVTHLLLVSDASRKGINVAQTIKDVSDSAIDYEKAGLIINRLMSAEEAEKLSIPPELNCLGWIPEDDTLRSFDIEGRSILEIDDSPVITAVRNCLGKIGL
ncbi:MAG: AAA family ATPase [Deltaproteobacteria bacterium]|jgi:CO dehydrogenase maturation factor|nr:AAA family ATPase [Deltaproteobacteria bacterium]MBT6504474.1 AAA family ATPase [Deltaproteobacteria bacterium]MBT7153983.1 AAA family ATPase [Deltaproteobacteria bacterium]MBT7713595.1 AAA family ATPase [Deltaproteobacteria bacterium]MBT7888901.1 AAA family ATPase [Deltaproteobacteria bacterium]